MFFNFFKRKPKPEPKPLRYWEKDISVFIDRDCILSRHKLVIRVQDFKSGEWILRESYGSLMCQVDAKKREIATEGVTLKGIHYPAHRIRQIEISEDYRTGEIVQ